MHETPRGNRLHIAILGRTNAGKSSLINALTGQDAALVSPEPGTTTDPVYKAMELIPHGPAVFIDTAGLDDGSELGRARVQRTMAVLPRADLALLVVDATAGWSPWEDLILAEVRRLGTAAIVAWNKIDLAPALPAEAPGVQNVFVSCLLGRGIDALREAIGRCAAAALDERPLVADLLEPGQIVLLIVPVDAEAPRGRLILPQVQTIREILDAGALAAACRDTELPQALAALARPPRLAITDSQAFAAAAAAVPASVPLTSFSILFARHKGDLAAYAAGAAALDRLADGDRILVAEACTHHTAGDDIARVKLPRWLRAHTGRDLVFDYAAGHDFPADLAGYRLIIQCGGCMANRREIISRIARAQTAGVPITNYGVAIAKLHGILPRALAPLLPEAGES
ncbi:MAG: [FeFe] hydrogenase H-cluster maturation GTPase HydF [Patescibacteria group bacterium]